MLDIKIDRLEEIMIATKGKMGLYEGNRWTERSLPFNPQYLLFTLPTVHITPPRTQKEKKKVTVRGTPYYHLFLFFLHF